MVLYQGLLPWSHHFAYNLCHCYAHIIGTQSTPSSIYFDLNSTFIATDAIYKTNLYNKILILFNIYYLHMTCMT